MKQPEDRYIIQQILQGGREAEVAFSDLAAFYGPKLYNQIFRIIRDDAQTKDVLQNTFIKIWKGLPSFNGDSSLYSWCYRIAYNESITLIEKEKKMPKISLGVSLVDWIPGTDHPVEVSGEVISDWLMEAVASLPEKQALTFQLKYFDDLKYSEISELIGTSEGALKANFHIASEKIKVFLLMKLNF
jgi:RNA polymerase sigma factor (sigma-70 family)